MLTFATQLSSNCRVDFSFNKFKINRFWIEVWQLYMLIMLQHWISLRDQYRTYSLCIFDTQACYRIRWKLLFWVLVAARCSWLSSTISKISLFVVYLLKCFVVSLFYCECIPWRLLRISIHHAVLMTEYLRRRRPKMMQMRVDNSARCTILHLSILRILRSR